MGIKHKKAALKRTGKTPEERSKEMSRRAKMGWKKLSMKYRMSLAKKLNKARWKNNK